MKDFLNSNYEYHSEGYLTKNGCSKRLGYNKPNGYLQMYVTMTGKMYVHRIIWEMHNGAIPDGMQIDHINGIRDDNRIENLRCVSASGNRRNLCKRRRRLPGVNGVNYNQRDDLWHAMISDNGKAISLGHYKSFISACEARIVAEVSLGYHRNHAMRDIKY
ncbi:gp45 [Escherichia phage phiEB49]|uniref:Gp45 n=1 Tax=Escherichia phage phiEB49 TaxID=1048207 RepID=F8UBV5_9CAUD|nr:HNH endonuclease [Escherichia phage phiEB49]AEI91245.1 gp45 [Escherichia phage phiEB49]